MRVDNLIKTDAKTIPVMPTSSQSLMLNRKKSLQSCIFFFVSLIGNVKCVKEEMPRRSRNKKLLRIN